VPDKPILRPLQHLNAASKVYPNAWKQAEQLLNEKGSSGQDWPGWCFLPIAGWYAIVSATQGGQRITDPQVAGDIGRLAAIGTWRYTQGIIRFDPDFYEELVKTTLSGEMPVEVLLRLPEWCVYIETPNMDFGGMPLFGFWCHLEYDVNTGQRELRLVLDMDANLLPFPVHLGDWPLLEAVNRSINESSLQAKKLRIALMRDAVTGKMIADQLQSLVAMVLYICSDEPDVAGPDGSSPHHPEQKRTKKGLRFFPPDKPTIWRVGAEIGALLREAKTFENSGQKRDTIKPHIRRAHWHGYWLGGGGNRNFRYRWLSPIIVRGKSPDGGTEKEQG
jgi:hypothetical protein